MKGTKPAVLVVDNDAVTSQLAPPSWMSSEAKAEWRRVLPILVERRILTRADLGSLENYCIATGRAREVEGMIRTAEPEGFAALCRIQDKAMATARLYAAELGLTPVSRSRPSIRQEREEGNDPLDIS